MIIDWLEEWFRGVLIDGITGNLSGLFDTVNQKVGEIAGEVGATPQGWNAGIFNMIRGLSETVIIPIAGAVLAFVMTYELIQMVTEKNNLHDIDTWMFFKWVFKSFAAVLIVTNTWNIVMGIFDMAQQVVNQSAGVIIGNTSIDIATVITDLQGKMCIRDRFDASYKTRGIYQRKRFYRPEIFPCARPSQRGRILCVGRLEIPVLPWCKPPKKTLCR